MCVTTSWSVVLSSVTATVSAAPDRVRTLTWSPTDEYEIRAQAAAQLRLTRTSTRLGPVFTAAYEAASTSQAMAAASGPAH